MYTAILFILLAGRAPLVTAHGYVKSWTVNGESKPGFSPSNAKEIEGGVTAERATDNKENGFADYTSPIVACGGVATEAAVPFWDLEAGSTVTAKWDQWPGHPGSVQEYMAFCGETCQGVEAASLEWFKIASESWTGTEWASDLISSRPDHDWSFDIPADLAPGAYLVRHEILAMHSQNQPQVYPVCFQAQLTGSGTAKPSDTTTFPAAYDMNDMFETYNVHDTTADHSKFVAPGPAVYGNGGSSGSTNTPATGGDTTSTSGVTDSEEGPDVASATIAPNSAVSEATASVSSTPEIENDEGSTVAVTDVTSASPSKPMSTQAAAKPATTSPNPPIGTSDRSSGSSDISNQCEAMNECKNKVNSMPNSEQASHDAAMADCDSKYKC